MAVNNNNKFLNYTQLEHYDAQIKHWVVDYTDDTLKIDLGGYMSTFIDKALDTTSTNAISNSAVATALNNKASKVIATTSTAGLMSSTDKTKLNGIATGANKTTVDTSLSPTSANPVRNSIIYSAISNRQPKIVAGNNTLITGTGLWGSASTSSTLGTLGLGVLKSDSNSEYYTYVYMDQYQLILNVNNSGIKITPAQITFMINSTQYSLNFTKAVSLGVLTKV